MECAAKQVSVTFDELANVVSIVCAGEDGPRDLNKPDGVLGEQPMALGEYDSLVGFQTVTVLAFQAADGRRRTCVKLMNCSYICI